MLKRTSLSILAAAVALLSATTMTSRAQQIYLNTFNTDDSANWGVFFSYVSPAPFASISNSLINFNFDYTTAGIPIAPHSALFGSAAIHHGLKMSACYTNKESALVNGAVTTGMSACPTNFSITANFVMHADVWINVDCGPYTVSNAASSFADNANDGTASTVFYGCGYGTAATKATTPGSTDAIWVGEMTDNGTAAQYRMYGPSTLGESSYQDGDYQSTGTLTPGFAGDPYVYNFGSVAAGPGCREVIDNTGGAPFAPTVIATTPIGSYRPTKSLPPADEQFVLPRFLHLWLA